MKSHANSNETETENEEDSPRILTSLKDMEVCCHVLCYVNKIAHTINPTTNVCTPQLFTLMQTCSDQVGQNGNDSSSGISRVLAMKIMHEVCYMLHETGQSGCTSDSGSVLYPVMMSFLSSLLCIRDISSSEYTKLKQELAQRTACVIDTVDAIETVGTVGNAIVTNSSIVMELELYICDQYSKCNRSFMIDRWNCMMYCSQLIGGSSGSNTGNAGHNQPQALPYLWSTHYQM